MWVSIIKNISVSRSTTFMEKLSFLKLLHQQMNSFGMIWATGWPPCVKCSLGWRLHESLTLGAKWTLKKMQKRPLPFQQTRTSYTPELLAKGTHIWDSLDKNVAVPFRERHRPEINETRENMSFIRKFIVYHEYTSWAC